MGWRKEMRKEVARQLELVDKAKKAAQKGDFKAADELAGKVEASLDKQELILREAEMKKK